MKFYGLDLGKGYTKAFDGSQLKILPSALGLPEKIKYADGMLGDNPSAGIHLETEHGEFYVGDLALQQSSLTWTLMQRQDVADQMKLVLALAALSELNASGVVRIVTGVPVNWFGDKDKVAELLKGTHTFTRAGRGKTTIEIDEVAVVTEPHGTAFSKCINGQGQIINPALAQGLLGVIDVGMYTTDFLGLEKLGYLEPASGSLQVGMAHVYEVVGRAIQNEFGLGDLELHQIDKIVRARKINISGQDHSLDEIVVPVLQGLAHKIIAKAGSLPSSLWKDNGRSFHAILNSGGGAHHVGAYLATAYTHLEVLAGAATSNPRGFYNGAVYKWSRPKARAGTNKKSVNGRNVAYAQK